MKYIIQTSDLRKQFRYRGNRNVFTGLFSPQWKYKDAVTDVTFAIEAGESVAFLGPNGAGKTTTTKMLAGLMKPTSGSVKVLGYEPFDRDPDFLRQIGLVMGNKAGLNWDLTAAQSFELVQKIYEIPLPVYKERLRDLSQLLHVDHVLDTQVRKLSLGERMKLELIGAILHDPKVLFLDEPTIGLDIDAKKNIRLFLRSLHEQGKTLILTSHDMDDISSVCERAVIISQGKLIYDGNMKDLKSAYAGSRYLKLHFTGATPPKAELEKHGEIIRHKKSSIVMKVEKENVMAVAAEIARDYPIQDITIELVELEEIISDVYSNGAK